MKKTLFSSMLAAALLGGQVFAYVPTKLEGGTLAGDNYIGALGLQASGGKVTVSSSADGSDMSRVQVIGGRRTESATSNTVIMTGGEVSQLTGGLSRMGDAIGNVVIVAGDSKVSTRICGGDAASGSSQYNRVYLVGKGATATIADAQGNKAEYTGGKLSLNAVVAGGDRGTQSGNSVDIYGTGIEASDLNSMQILNFHIANLDDGASPMITLSVMPLDLTNFLVPTEETPSPELALTFDALDSMEWKPGASVTLVNAAKGISIDETLLGKEYNIYRNGDPETVLGTATLKLERGEGLTKILKLVTNGSVPEPTTGTLGVLALAGLAARRRRK